MADIHDGNEARGIKLFGTTITLHNHNNKIPSTDQNSTKTLSGSKTFEKIQKTNIDQDSTKSLPDNKTLEKRDHQDSTISSSGSKVLEKRSKITTDQDTTKSSSSESEALDNKKPDKIVPCPRCKSKETKFCYFNNYNVNQPRHFCRACQRYWTAGGALRDVPIGAGRRKNKPPCLSSDIGQQFQFDDVAEEWYGGFEHVPAKKHLRWS